LVPPKLPPPLPIDSYIKATQKTTQPPITL
jgi:hypothetical protein